MKHQLQVAVASIVGLLALIGLVEVVWMQASAEPEPTPTLTPVAVETESPAPEPTATGPITIYITSDTEDLWVAFPGPGE